MILINTEVICAIVSFVGVVISGVVSWLISRSTANHELVKMERSWAHDAVVSSEEEFSSMAATVSRYAASNTPQNRIKAITAVSAIRAKENGQLASSLDKLYNVLQLPIHSGQSINAELSNVIDEKRKANCHAKRGNGNSKNK